MLLLYRSTLAEWRAYNMGVSTIPASGGGGLSPKLQKFITSGTFTLPDGYGPAKPLLIDIQVIGGGGGGSPALTNASGAITYALRASQDQYFGDGTQFNSATTTFNAGIAAQDGQNSRDGLGGGSGGIAKTQMYLTSNLTITVGAPGAKPGTGNFNNETLFAWFRDMNNSNNRAGNRNTDQAGTGSFTLPAGGSGGTSTAGAVSSTGGNGATGGYSGISLNVNANNWSRANGYAPSINAVNIQSSGAFTNGSVGTGGQPAGTNGGATPLLGALAGGSGNTTPVYGAFGVGGKRGDITTHSGVDGTGGGYASLGSSGAVIITYWS